MNVIRIAPTRPAGQPALRINWIAPFILSPHDPKTIYAGAQVLFKSTDRGDHWQEISPDLTNNDPEKINRGAAGSNIVYCDHQHDFGIARDRGNHLGGH